MTDNTADRLTVAILRDLIATGTPFMVLFNVKDAGEEEAPAVVREDAQWEQGLLLDFSGSRTFRDAEVSDDRFQFRVAMTRLYGRDITFAFRLSSVLQIGGDGFAFVRPREKRDEEPVKAPKVPARTGLRLVKEPK
jgi:hypothetical protein